jgi:hypothetical protein
LYKWEIAILDHQVAMADAAGANADQHFTVTRCREGAFLELDFAFRVS